MALVRSIWETIKKVPVYLSSPVNQAFVTRKYISSFPKSDLNFSQKMTQFSTPRIFIAVIFGEMRQRWKTGRNRVIFSFVFHLLWNGKIEFWWESHLKMMKTSLTRTIRWKSLRSIKVSFSWLAWINRFIQISGHWSSCRFHEAIIFHCLASGTENCYLSW